MKKNEIQSIAYFSKRERRGILFILLINTILLYLPGWVHRMEKSQLPPERITQLYSTAMDSTKLDANQWKDDSGFDEGKPQTEMSLFYFDPNTLDSVGWIKLGLKAHTVHTLLNYRNKGGKFYKPDDISKIWGIAPELASSLKAYVLIPDKQERDVLSTNNKKRENRELSRIDLNLSDSAGFEQLPGIGPVLAGRIVAYRKKLGGYYAVAQLKEVWGLKDSVYEKISPLVQVSESVIQKKDLNTATWEILSTHPYIRYSLAKLILRYKNQHGNFKSLKDIQQILMIDEITYSKIEHYFMVASEN